MSGNILSADISILEPPLLNDIQQKKFIEWKDYFLTSLDDTEKQSLVDKNHPVYINELTYSESPYLLQHANNPVNWKPWRSELLQKAKVENKLIFLSIGYSTCHWCHVMEKESFNDIEIASLINKNYLAIKVDREELPHIDDYYSSALEQVKGSAGWPITVIINGDGLPIFIDSYLGKEKLIKLLLKVNNIWQQQPDFLLAGAKNIDSLVHKSYEPQKNVVGQKYNAEIMNQKLLAKLDPMNGGFAGEIKFPEAALLLYMLDQLKRKSNEKLERALKLQLDKMISGGLYDHIEGGFHRYSTDSSWNIPHFEKMLYSQAQLIEVYAQAYQYFYDKKYLEVVKRTVDFLVDNFYIEGKGFASAMDADFEGEEGGYYLWSQEEINSLKIKASMKSSLLRTYSLSSDKGENSSKEALDKKRNLGVLLPILSNEATRQSIISLREKLILSRKSRGRINLDKKILTGWNGLAIKSLVTAGRLLQRKELLNIADHLAKQLWFERFQLSNSLLSRAGFEGKQKRITQSHLEDYAYLADAYISLYDVSSESHWLQKAQLIKEAALEHFSDGSGGFYNISNRGEPLSLKKSNDTELLAASSVLFDVLFKLGRRLGSKRLAKENPDIIDKMVLKVAQDPLNHLYGGFVLNQAEQGSTSNQRYFASANGQLTVNCRDYYNEICLELVIELKLVDGWHINSRKPFQEYLIPTKILVPSGFNVNYPDEKIVKLGFQKAPLSVYDGQFKLIISRKDSPTTRVFFELPLQACNDILCLLPEVVKFYM